MLSAEDRLQRQIDESVKTLNYNLGSTRDAYYRMVIDNAYNFEKAIKKVRNLLHHEGACTRPSKLWAHLLVALGDGCDRQGSVQKFV